MLRYIINAIRNRKPHQLLNLISRAMYIPRNVPGDVPGDVPGLQPLEPRLLLSGTAFVVTSLADNTTEDGQLTLREAILAANYNFMLNADTPAGSSTDADEITFDPSLFTAGPATLTLDGSSLFITDDLTITGPGQSQLTIDANQQSRVIHNFSQDSIISNLTLTGGITTQEQPYAAGLFNDGTLLLEQVTITDNNDTTDHGFGAGIFNNLNGQLTIIDSTISNNFASDSGGGINNAGAMFIIASTLSGNTTNQHGAAINNVNASLDIVGSSIINNTSGYNGGGISSYMGFLTIVDSTISGNNAFHDGGGMQSASDTYIIETTFANNTADDGAAIHVGDGSLILQNSKIHNNSAVSGGAGISVNDTATLNVTQSLIYSNQAPISAGLSNDGITTITHSTITANQASIGGGVTTFGQLTINNSIVALNHADTFTDILGPITINNSLIGIDPNFIQNPHPGPDAQYGTADDIPADFRLQSGSLAIDHADPNLTVDMNGTPIFEDFDFNPRSFGPAPDAGAYEFQNAPTPFTETLSTTVTILQDIINPNDNEISLREAIAYAAYLNESHVQFSPALTDSTITLDAQPLSITHPLTIDATPINNLTIDANQQSNILSIAGVGPINLINLNLTGGFAPFGAGIMNSASDLNILNSQIHNNTATSLPVGEDDDEILSGGAIFNLGNINIMDSTITNNHADFGGAINNFLGNVDILNSTISHNSATQSGGAIYHQQGSLNITNSTIYANAANSEGGAIYAQSGHTAITNTLLVSNATVDLGGAIRLYGSSMEINNSTIAVNRAEDGGGIYADSPLEPGTSLLINNSIISSNIANLHPMTEINLKGFATTNHSFIDGDPQFTRSPDPFLVAFPITPATTLPTNDDLLGDLTLLPTSPAINAADPTRLPPDTHDIDNDGDTTEPLPVDLAHNPRTIGHTLDIGAYEFLYPADFNYDDSVNLEDLALLANHFGQNGNTNPQLNINFTKGDANNDQIVNLEDLALLATYFGQFIPTPTPEPTPEPLTTPQPITSSQPTSDSNPQTEEAFFINISSTLKQSNPLTPNFNHINNLLNDDTNTPTTIL